MTHNNYIYIAVMALVSYAIRILPLRLRLRILRVHSVPAPPSIKTGRNRASVPQKQTANRVKTGSSFCGGAFYVCYVYLLVCADWLA